MYIYIYIYIYTCVLERVRVMLKTLISRPHSKLHTFGKETLRRDPMPSTPSPPKLQTLVLGFSCSRPMVCYLKKLYPEILCFSLRINRTYNPTIFPHSPMKALPGGGIRAPHHTPLFLCHGLAPSIEDLESQQNAASAQSPKFYALSRDGVSCMTGRPKP